MIGTDDIELTEEGEVFALALDSLINHAERTGCKECRENHATLLKAITAWVNRGKKRNIDEEWE